MRILNWKLFNESNSYIEGDIEDIVIHFCEGLGIDFKLRLKIDEEIYIYELSDLVRLNSQDSYNRLIDIHNNLAKDIDFHLSHFHDADYNYLVLSKYNTDVETGKALLDKLELTQENNDQDINQLPSGRTKRFSYFLGNPGEEGSIPIMYWKKGIEDGETFIAPRRTPYVYVNRLIRMFFVDDSYLKEWISTYDEDFSKSEFYIGTFND